MSEVLNANPTVRNASDLPSRRRQGKTEAPSKFPKGLFASTVPASAYLPDPFSPSTSSDSELSDEDDGGVEPIDEQEIYGRDILPRIVIAAPFVPDLPLEVTVSQVYTRVSPQYPGIVG